MNIQDKIKKETNCILLYFIVWVRRPSNCTLFNCRIESLRIYFRKSKKNFIISSCVLFIYSYLILFSRSLSCPYSTSLFLSLYMCLFISFSVTNLVLQSAQTPSLSLPVFFLYILLSQYCNISFIVFQFDLSLFLSLLSLSLQQTLYCREPKLHLSLSWSSFYISCYINFVTYLLLCSNSTLSFSLYFYLFLCNKSYTAEFPNSIQM